MAELGEETCELGGKALEGVAQRKPFCLRSASAHAASFADSGRTGSLR